MYHDLWFFFPVLLVGAGTLLNPVCVWGNVTSNIESFQMVFPSLEWFPHIQLLISMQLNTLGNPLQTLEVLCLYSTLFFSTLYTVYLGLQGLAAPSPQFSGPLGFPPFTMPWNLSQGLNLGNSRAHLISFPCLRDVCPSFPDAQCPAKFNLSLLLLFNVRGPSGLYYSVIVRNRNHLGFKENLHNY